MKPLLFFYQEPQRFLRAAMVINVSPNWVSVAATRFSSSSVSRHARALARAVMEAVHSHACTAFTSGLCYATAEKSVPLSGPGGRMGYTVSFPFASHTARNTSFMLSICCFCSCFCSHEGFFPIRAHARPLACPDEFGKHKQRRKRSQRRQAQYPKIHRAGSLFDLSV